MCQKDQPGQPNAFHIHDLTMKGHEFLTNTRKSDEIGSKSVDTANIFFDHRLMNEVVRQLLIGAGSIFMAPAGLLPQPRLRLTLPGSTVEQAIAGDISRVAADLCHATERAEMASQLELSI